MSDFDAEAFEVPEHEAPEIGREKVTPLRHYSMNKKSLDWVEGGLSRDAVWAWDVLAAYWRRRQGRCGGRVPINAEIKRKIGLSKRESLRRVLDELAGAGLITFEAKRGVLFRLTWVDLSGTTRPPETYE
jgi:hypothetical protein